MENRLKIGIIGTSWWSELMYLSNLKNHPKADTVAICGRNKERGEKLAKDYGIPKVFTDYRALLNDKNVQAVIIVTPDDLHYPMTMDALEAGLHVLCEKPLANSADQAREMYEKAEELGLKHMVLFTWRWMPHFQYLKQLIEDGYIGCFYHCCFQFIMGSAREYQYQWRFDKKRANGNLGDLGSHMIDFARWFVGNIKKVNAHLATFVDRPGFNGNALIPANDSAILTIEFADGSQGSIQVSAVAHIADRFAEQHVALHGEKGTLEVDVTFGGKNAGAVIRGARHEEEEMTTLEVPDKYWEQVERENSFAIFENRSVGPRLFVDCILNDLPVSPNFFDGFKVQEIVDAALKSHEVGRWISIQ